MERNTRFDFIRDLAQNRDEKRANSFERHMAFPRPLKPRDPPTRPSHLKARRYWPTHPLLRISKVIPAKLPNTAELAAKKTQMWG